MRPAAFRRGMSEKLRLEAESCLPAAPDEPMSAAIQGRGAVFMRRMPSATSARFSPCMGMRSATVPSVAKSVNVRHRCGWPKRPPSTCTSLSATPTPARMALSHASSILGSATGTPSGTKSAGSWWSVMARPTPARVMAAASTLQAMPQSTVTTNSGFSGRMRSNAAAVRP